MNSLLVAYRLLRYDSYQITSALCLVFPPRHALYRCCVVCVAGVQSSLDSVREEHLHSGAGGPERDAASDRVQDRRTSHEDSPGHRRPSPRHRYALIALYSYVFHSFCFK